MGERRVAKTQELGKLLGRVDKPGQGSRHGRAFVPLSPRRESKSGCLQPFRFVALDDEDHSRLRTAMESLMDRTMIGVPSSKGGSL